MQSMIITTALALLVSATNAQTLAENYRAAHATFVYGHPEEILDGLDGEWLPLSRLSGDSAGLPPVEEIERHVETLCGAEPRPGDLLTVAGPTTLTIARRGFEYSLHWIGNAQFTRSFDVEGYFRFLGFDDDKRFETMRIAALRDMSGEVGLFRPAPDILVMTANGRADILGRCPD